MQRIKNKNKMNLEIPKIKNLSFVDKMSDKKKSSVSVKFQKKVFMRQFKTNKSSQRTFASVSNIYYGWR